MAKKQLKQKVEGREPNDLCPCHSGLKYKKCCGKGMKGAGIYPRESARRDPVITNTELQKSTMSIAQFAMMKEMMSQKRARRF